MVTTWCEVTAADFVAMCEKVWTSGAINATHFLGGTSIDVQGERAVAQTKMSITQRSPLHGVVVDIVSTGRFYDLLERQPGGWTLLLRHAIYEIDRVQTVDATARFELDRELFNKWPPGYAHLAYLQTTPGLNVNPNLPGKTGPDCNGFCGVVALGWLEAVSMGRWRVSVVERAPLFPHATIAPPVAYSACID